MAFCPSLQYHRLSSMDWKTNVANAQLAEIEKYISESAKTINEFKSEYFRLLGEIPWDLNKLEMIRKRVEESEVHWTPRETVRFLNPRQSL
jgi:hypothetical protein